jgi:hypothetical protein
MPWGCRVAELAEFILFFVVLVAWIIWQDRQQFWRK